MRAGSTMRLGMVLWGVRRSALSVMRDMPDRMASDSKLGARGFGDPTSPASTP